MSVAVAVMFLAVACGSILPSAGIPSGAPTELTNTAACMRVKGYPSFPDPSKKTGPNVPPGPGNGVNVVFGTPTGNWTFNFQNTGVDTGSSAFQSALNTCLNANAPAAQSSGPPSAATLKRAKAVSACMRAHGIAGFPDPSSTRPVGQVPTIALATPAGGPVFFTVSGLDPQSSQFQAAMGACQSKMRP